MEESNKCRKKGDRQRKKKYFNDIRQQIEFYLGDVNLSKDRFFNGLLQESPCKLKIIRNSFIMLINGVLFYRYRY